MPIHPTAIVASGAQLDETVDIGPHCVIDQHVNIAAHVKLYQNVFVTGWTHIDEGCVLHPGVIVGNEPQDTKYKGERSYCRIGRDTVLREYTTVHRGTIPDSETVVGAECFFLTGSHVGHNCVVGDRVTLVNGSMLGGHVEVGSGAIISGGVGVHQFVRIGDLVMITGPGRVTMDVIPFSMADTEGRIVGLNRVGLKRAGVSFEEIRTLREAYQTLFGRGALFRQAVANLADQEPSPLVRKLVHFLQQPSKRGVAGRRRSSVESEKNTESPE